MLTPAQFEALPDRTKRAIAKLAAEEKKAQSAAVWASVYALAVTAPVESFRLFCAKLVRIVTKDGAAIKNLVWNASQEAFMLARTGRDVWLKGRQLGATTLELARDLWFAAVTSNAAVLIVVQPDKENKHVHRVIRSLRFMLEPLTDLEAHWSGPTVSFRNGATITVIDSGGSVATADKAGRGGTYHRVHVTESAYFPYGEQVINALFKAIPSKEQGGEYVEESTANGDHGVFYNHVQGSPENGLHVHFTGWYFADMYRLGSDESPAVPRDAHEAEVIDGAKEQGWTLTKSQLEWWRVECARDGWDRTRQEYPHTPESAFLGVGSGYFDALALDRLKGIVRQPMQWDEMVRAATQDVSKAAPFRTRLAKLFQAVNRQRGPVNASKETGGLWVWEPPTSDLTRTVSYLISVDTASGAGSDWLVAMVFNKLSLKHVATMRLRVQTPEFSRLLMELGYCYVSAMIVVEKNNHGHAVLGNLAEAGYPNIWRPDPNKRELSDLGFHTGPANRQLTIDGLVDSVTAGEFVTHDPVFHHEAKNFVRYPDGKVRAAAGEHDDEILCAAIGWRVMCGPRVTTPKRG